MLDEKQKNYDKKNESKVKEQQRKHYQENKTSLDEKQKKYDKENEQR